MEARRYLKCVFESYERVFGCKLCMKYRLSMKKGNHPELDNSELLDKTSIQEYQSIMGMPQWLVSLERIDICTVMMSLSSYRADPRRKYLDRARGVIGYLARMNNASIKFRTGLPDYSDISERTYSWERAVYGEVKEQIPPFLPKPLGNPIIFTHYLDANLLHCLLTGRSITSIIHFINVTPMDWMSKKRETVETATYGSEFVAAQSCVEQIINIRSTLRYLGVPILEHSEMFGDNKSVVNSSIEFYAKLHKRHMALLFHRV